MNTIIKIESHVYSEERLRDEMLDESLGDDIDSCGIVGPDIILPLRKSRCPELLFEYTENTTIRDVADAVCDEFGFIDLEDAYYPRIAFFAGNIRYWIDNFDTSFKTVLDKHLDPEKRGSIRVAVYVSADAGSIFEEDGIRYYMNSRERGRHHEPHIHLHSLDSCEEAVIFIKTGKIIGNFPRKLIKKTRKRVAENKRFFLEQWNALTDGLRVDINHYLGLIDY